MLDYVEKEKIDTKRIIIEVLEEEFWEEEVILLNIIEFKKRWFKIAIDDFWTGYSNFSRLVSIKPDFLKIDWGLIKKLSDPMIYDIVENITKLWHLLWAKTIAEFVATNDIQKKIEALWIDYSQWYLFSEPSAKLNKFII
jgi:EAL domain-containing protein (putative c-di-GMP-specific phosphodiesterase class I)